MVRGSRLTGVIAAATLVAAAVLAVGCGSTPTTGSGCSTTYKVGLVTDVGKLSDKSFNFDSYKGVQDAQADSSLCVQGRAIESSTEDDYPKNIGQFVDGGYNLIVTVGFKLGDATLKAAKANPNIKFVMVDNADFTDNPVPANVLGLLFKEDQPGFLAGALAGLLTKTNVIGAVAGLNAVPTVVHYAPGY